MIRLEAKPADAPVEVVELFAIGDQVYTVPAKPRVNVALKYLRDVRKVGPGVAEGALLEAMLGAEGYAALCEFDDLTADQLQAVTEAAAQLALGALEDAPEGNGGSGPRKSSG